MWEAFFYQDGCVEVKFKFRVIPVPGTIYYLYWNVYVEPVLLQDPSFNADDVFKRLHDRWEAVLQDVS